MTETAAEPLSVLVDGGEAGRIAFVVPDDGLTMSYAQLAERIEALAGQLAAAGVRAGDRVAIALPGGPEFVQLLLAVTGLGATAAPLNPAYTVSEFTFYLDDIAPRLMLIPDRGADAAASAAGNTKTSVLTLRRDSASPRGSASLRRDSASRQGWPVLLAGGQPTGTARPASTGSPDDIAMILHTSGTTSRPKQVPLLQRNLMASTRAIAAHYQLTSADVSFCAMPLFHVHGLVASVFATLASGGTVIAPRRLRPRGFWVQAREHGATWLSAGPTLHQMLLDAADADGPPGTLRFARSCSSALSPALLERAERGYGVPMLEAYGMTEASHQMTSNPLPPAARVPGSVGVPAGAQVGIADGAGRLLPSGQTGEVVVRGPGVMPGYVNNPAATAQAFFGDWFRTGDRGVLRDGYLYLEGRLKEMIIRGGENISPAEIEQVLLAHPAVSDAVCFGVADDKYGELVNAAVTVSGDTGAGELIEHCRGQLAQFKVPATIHIVPRIPRTATGKLQRRRVAEFITGGQAT